MQQLLVGRRIRLDGLRGRAVIKQNGGTPLLGIGVLLLLTLGCMEQNAPQYPSLPNTHPDLLIVVPGAWGVAFRSNEWGDHLTYAVKEDYPATHVLTVVFSALRTEGWERLKQSYQNPGIPSSHVRGWTSHLDGTGPKEFTQHQWMGEWRNSRGDIVWYTFMYRYPTNGTKNLSTLYVLADYTSAAVARKMVPH